MADSAPGHLQLHSAAEYAVSAQQSQTTARSVCCCSVTMHVVYEVMWWLSATKHCSRQLCYYQQFMPETCKRICACATGDLPCNLYLGGHSKRFTAATCVDPPEVSKSIACLACVCPPQHAAGPCVQGRPHPPCSLPAAPISTAAASSAVSAKVMQTDGKQLAQLLLRLSELQVRASRAGWSDWAACLLLTHQHAGQSCSCWIAGCVL